MKDLLQYNKRYFSSIIVHPKLPTFASMQIHVGEVPFSCFLLNCSLSLQRLLCAHLLRTLNFTTVLVLLHLLFSQLLKFNFRYKFMIPLKRPKTPAKEIICYRNSIFCSHIVYRKSLQSPWQPKLKFVFIAVYNNIFQRFLASESISNMPAPPRCA